ERSRSALSPIRDQARVSAAVHDLARGARPRMAGPRGRFRGGRMTASDPSVRVSVPAPEIAPVEAMLADLSADLALPPELFSVIEGDPQIDGYPLLPREGASVAQVVFDHRTQLVNEELARRIGCDASLPRDTARHGVHLGASAGALYRADAVARQRGPEAALEEALGRNGGRIAIRVDRQTHDALTGPTDQGNVWPARFEAARASLLHDLGLGLGPCELVVDDRVPTGSW